jgi:hypothetical protein
MILKVAVGKALVEGKQSERVTLSTLRLVMTACVLSSETYDFFKVATSDVPTSLLNLLLQLLTKGRDERYRAFVPLLKRILFEFEGRDSADVIGKWKLDVSGECAERVSDDTGAATRKEAVEKRKMRLRLEIEKNQRLFVSKAGDLDDATPESGVSVDFADVSEFKTGTCIICAGLERGFNCF